MSWANLNCTVSLRCSTLKIELAIDTVDLSKVNKIDVYSSDFHNFPLVINNLDSL